MAYVELHCHSHFSLLDGASTPAQLVERAFELGMPALALTDHNAVYGAVHFQNAAKRAGIKPIFGAELTLETGHHLTVLVQNAVGWENLCWLITQARHNAEKGEAFLPLNALSQANKGLIALSGCRKGEILHLLRLRRRDEAVQAAQRLIDLFGKSQVYIELQHHQRPRDNRLVADLVALAEHFELPYVASNNVHYATQAQRQLHNVLVCIHNNISLDEAERWLYPNSQFYLKSEQQMQEIFAAHPDAITTSAVLAEKCNFDLHYGLQELPHFSPPPGTDSHTYLQYLCDEALHKQGLNLNGKTVEQVTYELGVIDRAGLSNYFLIVWDLVRFSREQGILCQGRGSAANSLVAYLLGISPINPLEHNLVFERFLSDERQITPDIDIDFQADRREEVIQYIYSRYDHEHVAMACTFVTYRTRSAIRDVGKALGLPFEILDRLASIADTYNARDLDQSPAIQEVLAHYQDTLPWKQLVDLCKQIDGYPRHLGIHNGGMIVTHPQLARRVPTEPAAMIDRTVIQWDKDALEEAGLCKIDVLGLRMLSAIAEALAIIEAQTGTRPDLSALSFDDPSVYDMISLADTVGVFQVESRAQAQLLPRFRPRSFADLIVAISLIRPGPIQGEMVHPYLRRRMGEEQVSYLHPSLEPALAETLGVVLYQEQVLKVAKEFAGFTPGQGEQLRRALGNKRPGDALNQLEQDFYDGAMQRGASQEASRAVFDILRAFGGYSFPKSHAAAFALLVYQSAWLKLYYPQAFYTALLCHQPMGYWSPAVIVNDAKRHGIRTLPVSIRKSASKCTVEGRSIRLGLQYVKGIGDTSSKRIVEARKVSAFDSLADFCKRTQLPRRQVEHLILAGAMDEWQITRRKLIWQLGTISYNPDELNLVFGDENVTFPHVGNMEAMAIEYEMLGLSLHDHIMTAYRGWLDRRGVLGSQALDTCPPGKYVQIAGLVLIRQAPPTAKGHQFITLEDEKGFLNVVVRPQIYARFRPVIRDNPVLIVSGTVQRNGSVTNLIATSFSTLGETG